MQEIAIFNTLDLRTGYWQVHTEYPQNALNASSTGTGAILKQEKDGEEHVVDYALRLFSEAEKSYSVSEINVSVVWAVEEWRPYLDRSHFEVMIAHSAFTWVFNHPNSSSRLTK